MDVRKQRLQQFNADYLETESLGLQEISSEL